MSVAILSQCPGAQLQAITHKEVIILLLHGTDGVSKTNELAMNTSAAGRDY